MSLEYLDYDHLPSFWKPKRHKYEEFCLQIGQLNDECKYWIGFPKKNKTEELFKKRNRRDRITVESGRKQIKQLSFIWYYGDIPNGKKILNRCKKPLCINPRHMR